MCVNRRGYSPHGCVSTVLGSTMIAISDTSLAPARSTQNVPSREESATRNPSANRPISRGPPFPPPVCRRTTIQWPRTGNEEMQERFEKLAQTVDDFRGRFEAIAHRFDTVENQRFDAVDKRFDGD